MPLAGPIKRSEEITSRPVFSHAGNAPHRSDEGDGDPALPVYPVCDQDGRLLGVLRGQMLFEAQAVELSAQAGSMVGVEREERLHTVWSRSLKLRHPWLQLNLLTAFVAAAVVGVFQETIDRIVVLAVFLPVLGQSVTRPQALAVALWV
jgi:magnesium transporter